MPSINTNQHLMNKSVAASGAATFSCGDTVAKLLEGRPLYAIQDLAAHNGIETEKYLHLNPGHQRMILGNMLRKKFRAEVKAFEEINIGSGADAVFDDWTRILDSVVVLAKAA